MSSRHAHSAAHLATLLLDLAPFQTSITTFFPKKRLVTNLATSWTNFSESLCDLISTAASARDQCARSSFSASALFSEHLRGAAHSAKTDIIASLILHAKIAEITAQKLSLSYIVYYLISSDNGSIKL